MKTRKSLDNFLEAPVQKKAKLVGTKHLVGVLGLSSGTALTEIDVLDRLNDVKAVTTPTSISYTPGGYDLLGQLANNPVYHDFSHFLVTTGVSGGPNNTLGILAAAASMVVGGLAARSYLRSDRQEAETGYKSAKGALYSKAAAAVSFLSAGIYLGSQSFLPVVNDVLYKAPLSSMAEAAIGGAALLSSIYTGLSYLRQKRFEIAYESSQKTTLEDNKV